MPNKTATSKTAQAWAILRSDASTALGLLQAIKVLFGEEYWHWEPDTLWLTLDPHGVDLTLGNRAKIQAGIALITVASFYWDGIVFEKTALSFDGEAPNPDALEEATTAQLAWAVEEAERIIEWHKDPAWDFKHEPAAYASVVMHREGLVLAPSRLSFAQESLDILSCKETCGPLKTETEKAWNDFDKESMDVHAFPETPVGVQLARLSAVEIHCRERRAQLTADITSLT